MRTLIALTLCLLAAASPAWSTETELKPSEVFAADAPSIVLIKSFDKDGTAISLGSGVVIAKDTVVSNCHVIEKAATASVFYQHKQLPAKLLYADVEHDLCSFTVKGLSAPPVRMGATSQVKVGDSAYAIGAPEGLELTLSGGLISSLRNVPGGVVLQMTTPISPGSSGGGLFDSQARLIGITSYYMKQGEQLNFALPVDWVNELPQRGKLPIANSENISQTARGKYESDLQKGIRALHAGDYTAALKIFEPLAKSGNAVAQDELGWMYWFGSGVSLDYAQAAVWFHKAAIQGDADAQFALSMMYDSGQGVPQDYVKEAAWLRKAAEQGDVAAQAILGGMYELGQGVPKDYGEAALWYRKAAIQGNSGAQSSLGMLYHNGEGVPLDYAQAISWFHKAAIQGDAVAQFYLGVMYDNGEGISQDYTQAAAWYHEAAEQGNAEAQYNIGLDYEQGVGVPQDYAQAVLWFSKAAEQGNTNAQYSIGQMYDQGMGVSQDYGQAVVWYRKAAAQGNADALNDLGVLYEFGQSVLQDYVAAYALFNLSASLDSSKDNKAATNRSTVMGSMTSAQVDAGQALTRKMQRVGVLKALDAYSNSGSQ